MPRTKEEWRVRRKEDCHLGPLLIEGGVMTVPAKVAMFLRANLEPYCDDCLGALLRLGWGSDRNMAQNATYALAQTAEFQRQKAPCSQCAKTKLVTRAVVTLAADVKGS
jgi:hypothetical protein